ncbi:MAG: indolepyruvate ferredoxin oxidoreductase family protein [Sphingomonadales bacterium]
MLQLDYDYKLKDNLSRLTGRVFLTGTQALIRMILDQARLDKRDGLNTAGFISGYRGSPLGAVDQQAWRSKAELDAHDITFLPAINEDLAATACLGTQRAGADPKKNREGVFALWYGKGPGVDRSGDALKHGNAYGTTPKGGVLVVAGDDHGCVSSSMSHQSDQAFQAWSMPIVNPAGIQDYSRFGLYGWALSRFSGTWVGFKAISEIVESAASVELENLPTFETPDYEAPEGGLHYRWPDYPSPLIEKRLHAKLDAVRAFAKVNSIDDIIADPDKAQCAILTTGKAHDDVMEAVRFLNIDLESLGIRLYKIGLSFPLEPTRLHHVLRGVKHVLVVEEKGPVVETQVKELLFNESQRPQIWGKKDTHGADFIETVMELRPSRVIRPLVAFLETALPGIELDYKPPCLNEMKGSDVDNIRRMPYFCSGCPHNTSTKVPEGSRALAGIGCHFMANWMERSTEGLTQMGGEGVDWVAQSLYTDEPHVFQNLGDGTYYHSGFMAIRQAVAAKTNITYKILFNDAVAMTGGQPVDGVMTVPQIAAELLTEGVREIVIVTDEPEKYDGVSLANGVRVHHRREMDEIQRHLRDVKGVTGLIYDQTCAAEKRRRRKKGEFPDPPRRIFINSEVCEGCGDCGLKSNCLSILPKETPLGRKRQIDQYSCNKDYSCVEGFCPSFVSVMGGKPRKGTGADIPAEDVEAELKTLPAPTVQNLDTPYDLLFTGIGGTGVVTVAALVTMAAHLEGKGATQLDFMGFAQKGGAVLSFVRLGKQPGNLNQVRIDEGRADALIACDTLVAANTDGVKTLSPQTRVLINDHETPTGDFTRQADFSLHHEALIAKIGNQVGRENITRVDAIETARRLLGDTIGANMFLCGYGWQMGLVPVSQEAFFRAVELNGVAIEANKRAFNLGRLAAHGSKLVAPVEDQQEEQSLDELIEDRMARLSAYQSDAYAARYQQTLTPLLEAEAKHGSDVLSKAAARYLYKMMAIKDEYEVARLFSDGSFKRAIEENFEGDFILKFHLAPPLLSKDERKMTFGPWMMSAFKLLAKLKGLRGTALDIFGKTEERRMERALLKDYEADIALVAKIMRPHNAKSALELLEIPEHIRGFGSVKLRHVKDAQARRAEILERLTAPQGEEKAA